MTYLTAKKIALDVAKELGLEDCIKTEQNSNYIEIKLYCGGWQYRLGAVWFGSHIVTFQQSVYNTIINAYTEPVISWFSYSLEHILTVTKLINVQNQRRIK